MRIIRPQPGNKSLRIEQLLRTRIARGEWKAGALLPNRKALAEEFGVAVGTIDRAITQLVQLGVLTTQARHGTFVAPSKNIAPPARTRVALPGAPASSWHVGILASLAPGEHRMLYEEDVWLTTVLSTIERGLAGRQASSRFVNLHAESLPTAVGRAIAELRDEGAHGIILVNYQESAGLLDQVIAAIGNEPLALTYIGANETLQPIPHAFFDQRYIGYEAARHLLQCGYRRIALMAPYIANGVEQRIVGAREAVTQAGLPADALRIFPAERSTVTTLTPQQAWQVGYRLAYQPAVWDWLVAGGLATAPPAMLAMNDSIAFGLLDAVLERGLRPGEEVGLVGIDDCAEARQRGLTSVRPPYESLGAEAARLLAACYHGDTTRLQVRLRSQLVPRATTRRLPSS